MCIIKSLGIEHKGYKIITDIDDCIIYTTTEILNNKIKKQDFWFDEKIYEKYKNKVFENVQLTDWGIELLELIKKGEIKDYKFITAANNRIDILTKRLNTNQENIIENISDIDKIKYINSLKENTIYVDDKSKVLSEIKNHYVTKVNYPKPKLINKHNYNNRLRL